MKMKKLLIVVSMLAVMFSLAGCGKEQEKPFEYDESQIVMDVMYLFDEYSDVSDEYAGYYLIEGTEFEKSAIKGIQQAVDTDRVGRFEDYKPYLNGMKDFNTDDAEFENAEDYVSVTILNKAANRDVEVTVKFVENADYYIQYDKLTQEINEASISEEINQSFQMSVDDFLANTPYQTIDEVVKYAIEGNLTNMGVYRYVPEEMVVTAVYSKGELMKQAGMNTLIGMGTVFVVLIFISFIISLFKFLPALFAKKPSVPEAKEAPRAAVAASAPVADTNLVNDAELVAVITAAIYAASGSAGNGALSKDKLVVRSIRRVKK